MSREKNKAETLERFRKDTADHKMTIRRDDGLYRHLRFRKPGTGVYGFDIVTWPGHLAISGDMGASVFTRLDDMFQFFRETPERHEHHGGLYINSGYWAEKCIANDGEKKRFSLDLFKQVVRDHFDQYMATQDSEAAGFSAARDALWEHVGEELFDTCDEETGMAISLMDEFTPGEIHSLSIADTDGYSGWFDDFRFSDAWDMASSVEDYTFHFLWRLCAIAHAVKSYDDAKAMQAVPS